MYKTGEKDPQTQSDRFFPVAAPSKVCNQSSIKPPSALNVKLLFFVLLRGQGHPVSFLFWFLKNLFQKKEVEKRRVCNACRPRDTAVALQQRITLHRSNTGDQMSISNWLSSARSFSSSSISSLSSCSLPRGCRAGTVTPGI